jgi:hypothetical protein
MAEQQQWGCEVGLPCRPDSPEEQIVFAIPVLGLIGLYAVMPQRASKVLVSLRAWMEKNGHVITVVLFCFVFGAFFLLSGLSGA